MLAFLFSTVMPLASLFGFLFFLLKFYVEKYNMIFVYLKEFEAKGRLKDHIMPMQLFAIYMSQCMNFGFLQATAPSSGKFFLIGIVLVFLQIVIAIIIKVMWARKAKIIR